MTNFVAFNNSYTCSKQLKYLVFPFCQAVVYRRMRVDLILVDNQRLLALLFNNFDWEYISK